MRALPVRSLFVLFVSSRGVLAGDVSEPESPGPRRTPFVVRLEIPAPRDADDSTGGIIVADVNGARLADLDGDRREEVRGATILSAAGELLTEAAPFRGHMDSVFVADVRPELPGLEVVLLEEGSNHVQLLGRKGMIWRAHHAEQEPQNAAVGRFGGDSDEIFIWCRTRYNEHQKPFVLAADGAKVCEYAMDDVAPADWTVRGVEVIHSP